MCQSKQWITPFIKQCFAISSVIWIMIACGISIGYNTSLFSELKKTNEIPLDLDAESWLASVIGLTLLVGAIFSSVIMETIGRRPAIAMSSIFMISGWISITFASSFTHLIIGKIFQGIAVGLVINMGGILIGEYCSPKLRGPFVALIPLALYSGVLIAHAFGIFYNWRQLSTICTFLSLPPLVLAVLAPESPSFLVVKGRYEECRKVFRWLRGNKEDDELEKMIKADMIFQQINKNKNCNKIVLFKNKTMFVIKSLKRKEFYTPIIIMMHMNAFNQFSGINILDVYSYKVYTSIYGTEKYMFQVITSLDIFRLVASLLIIYIIRRLKRRSMLLIIAILNISINILIVGYIYARKNGFLPVYHMAIGIILQHLHFSFVGTASLTLVFLIDGEIFPLAGRGLCGMISSCISSLYIFVNVKSALYLFSLIGLEGSLCFYTLIVAYTVIMIYVLLPETKNKTLQEIENKFRGYVIGEEEEAVELNDMTKLSSA